jgi:platelet-activating factor acetylhydrolase IB subunit alpha
MTDPGSNEGMPTAPEKFTLVGHRDTITCVAFHPVYSVIGSSS